MKYTVIAYDTDYGIETSWSFDNKLTAHQWAEALNYDYGDGTAIVIEDKGLD